MIEGQYMIETMWHIDDSLEGKCVEDFDLQYIDYLTRTFKVSPMKIHKRVNGRPIQLKTSFYGDVLLFLLEALYISLVYSIAFQMPEAPIDSADGMAKFVRIHPSSNIYI